MYAIVDCNNFYASCERVFVPNLIGKPIVVLSNNDGCVIALSNEAKKLGIPMGAVAFKHEKEFIQKGIKVFSSNYALYGDLSNRVHTILKTYTPDIEVYSIDECFLKFDGFDKYDLVSYAKNIRKDILQKTLVPTCVGIAKTKTLSKVANRIAKKFSALGAVYCIDTEDKRVKALKWLDISDVWGIGRKHANRLKSIGINKAFDFTQLPDDYIRKEMSVVGLRLKKELLGIECLNLEVSEPKKNIATTRSFDKTYSDKEYIQERISTFAVTCAEKLRKQNSVCTLVTVFVRTNFFDKNKPQYSNSFSINLRYATNSSIDIVKGAKKALDIIYKQGYDFKKAGVILSGIEPDNTRQLTLFDTVNPKHIALMQAMDKLNNKYHDKKIKLASQSLKRTWKMRQERLSPNYTTNWNDIIVIK